VTGCLAMERNLVQWNLNGELIYDWGQSHRIQDLAVSPNGHHLIAMDRTHHIHVYNFVTRELEYEMDLKTDLCSLRISQDSRHILAAQTDGVARTIDLETRETVKTFTGQKGSGEWVIRSAFGGANESFVISGSEGDYPCSPSLLLLTALAGNLFIFHKENGSLVEKLDAHNGCCSAVSWNPADPCMFATGGDDKTIRM
jgi:WD40 repeat protein